MLLSSPGDGSRSGRQGARARLAAVRRDFGPWRARRPFVGGVLIVLAGLEMLLSGPIDIGKLSETFGLEGLPDMQLAIGIEGFQATVLPIALVVLGVLSVVQPVHRIFYGVIVLAISVYSLSGVNLGGWVVGFLLGAIGGIVVVSWSPADVPGTDADGPGERSGDGAARDGIFEVSDDATDDSSPFGTDDPSPDVTGERPGDATVVADSTRDDRGTLQAKSAAVVLAGVLAVSGTQPMSSAGVRGDICWDPLDWIPSITCEGDDDHPSSPSPSASPSSSPSGSAPDKSDDGTDDGDQDGSTGSGDPDGSDDATGDDGDGENSRDEETEDAAATLFSEDESTQGLSVGYVCDGERSDVTLPMVSLGEDNRNTFSLPADLRTKDLEISGIQSIALVSVPVTHGAERRDALRIVADHVKAPGFWLKSYAYDDGPDGEPVVAGTDTNAGYVSMDGDATMYISGINLGCPDFEEIADEPPESVVAWLLALSGAQMDLLGATSDVQVWSGFREQVWGDPLHPIGEGPTAGQP